MHGDLMDYTDPEYGDLKPAGTAILVVFIVLLMVLAYVTGVQFAD